jgi:Family of unknown function (DUF6399)
VLDQSITPDTAPATPRYGRTVATGHLDDFRQQQRTAGTSARQFARDHDLPRSTLQYWAHRRDTHAADPVRAAFLDSPSGLTFVHQLCTAAHLIFCLQGPCGLRLLSAFLRCAGLDSVIAASTGACHARQVQLEQAVVTFAQQQRQQLASGMAPRDITVAADETYHPACCLVALDAAAGFLLVEKYAARRDQATWDAALAEGLLGLPAVTVRQVVADCAKGLVAHAEQGLGVPHSPDLFHAQHELTKALAATLAAQTREARGWLERVQDNRTKAQQAAATAAKQPRDPGRPVDHVARVAQAEQSVAGMARHLDVLEGRQEALRAAVRGLGEDDHPIDLTSGQGQDADAVRRKLEQRLLAVEQLAEQARVSAKAAPALKKVRRQLPGLVAVVAFFWVRAEAGALARFGAGAWVWAKRLLCGEYVRRVAGPSKSAQRRRQLLAVAESCQAAARAAAGSEPACGWAAAERWAREVAGWFARSSSAVEGRNGQLALRYHSLHRLPERKLQALTAIHNYWLKRGDGTTAAERFFGSKPADLFGYLMGQLPVPSWPAKRRPKAA